MTKFNSLKEEIRQCTVCSKYLPLGPRPVFAVSPLARIVIIGQAPGAKVHASGIPWDDASGRLLREWLGVDESTFYDEKKIALMPMGFCYPGKGSSGDLPPRPECAPLWHEVLFSFMKKIDLTILIGQYSQAYYLGERRKESLTATVKSFKEYLPQYLPLPHPSPRNRIWLRKNKWFEKELLPVLRKRAGKLL